MMTPRQCLLTALRNERPDRVPMPLRMSKFMSKYYMPGGGYIMDGSNNLVYETPVENVRALADAGREFGIY